MGTKMSVPLESRRTAPEAPVLLLDLPADEGGT